MITSDRPCSETGHVAVEGMVMVVMRNGLFRLQFKCQPPMSAYSAAAGGAPPGSSEPPPSKTVRVVVKGRVQGVFYRNWTVDNAQQLGLNGWVRNKRDGSVEALFSGKPELITEMEWRCRLGPPDAMVTGFQVFTSSEDPGVGFEHKPTV